MNGDFPVAASSELIRGRGIQERAVEPDKREHKNIQSTQTNDRTEHAVESESGENRKPRQIQVNERAETARKTIHKIT